MYNSPALIIGDDPVNVLGVAKNLGRFGIPIYRIGTTDSKILCSRYIKLTWVSEQLEDSSDTDYVEHIRNAFKQIGRKFVLYPLSDIHVLRISENLAEISNWCFPLVAQHPIAKTLVNKRLFYQSLANFGVPHPKSLFPQTRELFFEAASEVGYPVFLRPEISPLFARKFRRKGLVAKSPDELAVHLDSLDETGLNIMVQEIIPGDARCMHGCAGLRTSSELLTFCYRRIREYPPKFGCGSLIESVSDFSNETRLVEYLEGIGYEGIFDAEFKLDPRDNKFKMIEINARSWWQNLHPSASGINIIKASYDYMTGSPIQGGGYRTGVKWMHLYNDYFARKESGLGFFSWLQSVISADAFDMWSRDDMRPAISYFSTIAFQKIRKIMRISK